MSHILSDLTDFLDQSPTPWHTVRQLGNRLACCDFIPLDEQLPWTLEPGKKYFVSRGGAFCAFILPSKKPKKMVLLAAHTDSPALKIKPQPSFYRDHMAFLGVEVYGSPLLSSWLNRDLGIAGRAIVTNIQGEPEEKLIFCDDLGLVIPQLAIHLDREVNDKGLVLNKQDHLCPLLGLFEEPPEASSLIEHLLRRHLSFHSLISAELFLVPLESPRFLGYRNEMLASYRLDNLASVHACASAMAYLDQPSPHTLQMAIFWDHEEIGSHTQAGAHSPFLTDLLRRMEHLLALNPEEALLLRNHSLCLSVDMAHAFNPNYAEKYDDEHAPRLGKGIAIKYNAQQKYASTAATAAPVIQACRSLNLPHQSFVCRSDLPCGSTVGPIVAQTLGIPTVDIGIPQLSMHSIREIMACQDYLHLCQLLTHLTHQDWSLD